MANKRQLAKKKKILSRREGTKTMCSRVRENIEIKVSIQSKS